MAVAPGTTAGMAVTVEDLGATNTQIGIVKQRVQEIYDRFGLLEGVVEDNVEEFEAQVEAAERRIEEEEEKCGGKDEKIEVG